MTPRALLELTAELLKAVLKLDQPADAVLSAFFRQRGALGSRERHTLAETAYEVLRRKPLYGHLAQSGHGPLERRLAILAWQGSPGFLESALSQDERGWREQALAVDRATLPEPLRHQLPAWLADRLKAELPEGSFWPLVEALDRPAPLDLRVNVLKARRDEAAALLAAEGFALEPTPASPWGLRLAGKPALTRLALFQSGAIEVQDEGSQLLALLSGASRGEMVVDFCAGAGGKTLAMGAMMRNTGRLYAWDVSAHRLAALKPRLARSGLSNVHPGVIAHERDERIKRLAGKIDRVLVDAPCSGLGTLRRNPDLKWRQGAQAIDELQAKQRAILAGAARLPRAGGRLVYATCSLLRAENEAVAEAFDQEQQGRFRRLDVAELLEAARVPDAANLTQDGCLRLWPHRHQTDGFFAAAWERI